MATSSVERSGTSFLPVSVAPPKDEIQPKTPSIALETRQQGRGATPLRAKVRRAPALKTLPSSKSCACQSSRNSEVYFSNVQGGVI